uniref:Major Facilitator Superfamily (MFS) putative n=1 Tax=Albugo laibachii Nc14 TaxID=890382 RepID=F0WN92_9STRA|nr:Major Facilitator Superfamily (MFS) putative [Albugo laibachii Nc14]|eukprot:CCA22781.1 Major Facilitator Superfamily (MFS) putative [Albugo laibachii Nc14]
MMDECNQRFRDVERSTSPVPRVTLQTTTSPSTETLLALSLSSNCEDNRYHANSVKWILFSVIGGIIYGHNVSLAAILPYIETTLKLSSTQQEIISATATLSDAISMLFAGVLADTFGRRPTANLACVCSIFGAIGASLFSLSATTLILWRLLSGIGNGISILLLPMYISECVDAASRSRLLSCYQLGVSTGCTLPYIYMAIDQNWRRCLAFGSLPAVYILLSLVYFLPESLHWSRLAKVSSGGRSESLTVAAASELVVGILLAYVNNCIDAPLFYGPKIIASALPNYSQQNANMFGLVSSLVGIFAVLFAGYSLVNQYPRRQLYLICLFLVVCCFLVLTVIFTVYPKPADLVQHRVAIFILLVTILMLNVVSTIGPGILFVVILSELFHQTPKRATYTSWCTFAMSFFSLVINGTLLTLFDVFGVSITWGFYGCTYALCFAVLYRCLPDSKNRQLI